MLWCYAPKRAQKYTPRRKRQKVRTRECPLQPDDRTDLFIAELQDRVRSLEEANRENRRIIAALTSRIPAIEAPADERPADQFCRTAENIPSRQLVNRGNLPPGASNMPKPPVRWDRFSRAVAMLRVATPCYTKVQRRAQSRRVRRPKGCRPAVVECLARRRMVCLLL